MHAETHVTPASTPEEAAAIAAVLARLRQGTAPAAEGAGSTQTPWQRTARLEAVARASAWE